jgi:hypothetical protein
VTFAKLLNLATLKFLNFGGMIAKTLKYQWGKVKFSLFFLDESKVVMLSLRSSVVHALSDCHINRL